MKSIIVAALMLLTGPTFAESALVFKGRPIVKVSEGGIERVVEKIEDGKAINLECVISKIGKDYYWASRENTLLKRTESGAFVTFTALNGSGYVRMIKSDLKKPASVMSETEKSFDYVEHFVQGLRTITYFGSAQ